MAAFTTKPGMRDYLMLLFSDLDYRWSINLDFTITAGPKPASIATKFGIKLASGSIKK